MLTPIIAVQPSLPTLAAASAETANNAQQQPRGPISVSPLQSDVVMKIVDTLSRHFIGKDVLPPEALARLVETLAQVLKVPPLPNETTMEFARRLAAIVETLPPEVRQLAERQLGLRPLGIPARVLAEALRNPNGSDAARIATVLETAPQAANGTGGRLGSAPIQQQAGPPVQLAAALAAVLGAPGAEIEALQSILKATHGQEDNPDQPRKAAGQQTEAENAAPAQEQPEDGEPAARGKIERLADMLQKAMINGRLPADARPQQAQIQSFAAGDPSSAAAILTDGGEMEGPARTAQQTAATQRAAQPATAMQQTRGTSEVQTASPGRVNAEAADLAGALAALPDETVDALVERLSRTLKAMEQTATAPTAPAGHQTKDMPVPVRAVPLIPAEALAELPLPADGTDADEGAPVKQASQTVLLDTDTGAAERKEQAASRTALASGAEEVRRDMNLPLRGGEMTVVRDIIPFAVLQYLPAENEAAVTLEEEEPALPPEEEEDGEAQDGDGETKDGGEEDPAESTVAGEAMEQRAAEIARVMDGEAANEEVASGDDEAYQAYIRMGGIL